MYLSEDAQIRNGLFLRTKEMCCLVTRQLVYNPIIKCIFLVDTRIRSGLYGSAAPYDCRRFSHYVSAHPVKLWLRRGKMDSGRVFYYLATDGVFPWVSTNTEI